ncbi:MAG: hypothetical protein K2F81_08935, partial [Ruminococcus sp.]|nr:hypothetical protein [Ruminococcus sp.]
ALGVQFGGTEHRKYENQSQTKDIAVENHILFNIDRVHDFAPFKFNRMYFKNISEWHYNGTNQLMFSYYHENKTGIHTAAFIVDCLMDDSRSDNKQEYIDNCDLQSICNKDYLDLDITFKRKDVIYLVIDMFKLGVLTDEQIQEFSYLYYQLTFGKGYSGCCTPYFAINIKTKVVMVGLWNVLEQRAESTINLEKILIDNKDIIDLTHQVYDLMSSLQFSDYFSGLNKNSQLIN